MREQEFENDSRCLALVSQLMVELSTEVVVTGKGKLRKSNCNAFLNMLKAICLWNIHMELDRGPTQEEKKPGPKT